MRYSQLPSGTPHTSTRSLRHVLKLGILEHTCKTCKTCMVIGKIKQNTRTATFEIWKVLPHCFIRVTCCGVFHVPGFSMCDTLHFSEWGCTAGLGRFARIMYIRTHSYWAVRFRFAPYKGEDYFCRKKIIICLWLTLVTFFCSCFLFLSATLNPLPVEGPPLQGKER